MAKNIKQTLIQDEILAKALVPVNEQPYEVPENWVWTRLININEYQGKSVNPSNNENSTFELYSVPSFEKNYPDILAGADIGSSKQAVERNDVLICKINPRINRVWIVSEYTHNILVASSEWIIVRNSVFNEKYFMWYFRSLIFREFMLSNVSGVGGSLMRAQPKYVATYPVPLPPLDEQQRIVERIESLFEKLDQAKELVQTILDSFETRRAAILHKAFTGELTVKWREKNGVGLESWEEKRFGEAADIKSNLVDPKDYPSFPHIAPDNIEKKTGVLLDYKTIKEDSVTSGKHRFVAGQILYSKIRPYLSKVVLVDFDGLCSADMYPIEAKGDNKYLWYVMLSDNFLAQASSAGSRSVLPKINQKELNALTIPLPSLPEQVEIVHILDSLFEKEQRAHELSDIIQRIETMKKSILARAFRGELRTNDPTEESEIELLKEQIVNS